MAASGPDPSLERRALHLDFDPFAPAPDLPQPRRSTESVPPPSVTPRDHLMRLVERAVGHLAPTLWQALMITGAGVAGVAAIAVFAGLLPAAGAAVLLIWIAFARRG